VEAEQFAAAHPQVPDGIFGRALAHGLTSGIGGLKAYGASTADAYGAHGLARGLYDSAQGDMHAAEANAPPPLSSVHDVGSGINYAAGQLGGAASALPLAAVGSGIGALTGGARGAVLGGAAAFHPVMAGDVAMGLRDNPNLNPQEKWLRANAVGGLANAAALAVPGYMGRSLLSNQVKGTVGRNFAAHSLGLGAGMTASDAILQGGEMLDHPDQKYDLGRGLESGVGAMVGFSPMTAGHAVLGRMGERGQTVGGLVKDTAGTIYDKGRDLVGAGADAGAEAGTPDFIKTGMQGVRDGVQGVRDTYGNIVGAAGDALRASRDAGGEIHENAAAAAGGAAGALGETVGKLISKGREAKPIQKALSTVDDLVEKYKTVKSADEATPVVTGAADAALSAAREAQLVTPDITELEALRAKPSLTGAEDARAVELADKVKRSLAARELGELFDDPPKNEGAGEDGVLHSRQGTLKATNDADHEIRPHQFEALDTLRPRLEDIATRMLGGHEASIDPQGVSHVVRAFESILSAIDENKPDVRHRINKLASALTSNFGDAGEAALTHLADTVEIRYGKDSPQFKKMGPLLPDAQAGVHDLHDKLAKLVTANVAPDGKDQIPSIAHRMLSDLRAAHEADALVPRAEEVKRLLDAASRLDAAGDTAAAVRARMEASDINAAAGAQVRALKAGWEESGRVKQGKADVVEALLAKFDSHPDRLTRAEVVKSGNDNATNHIALPDQEDYEHRQGQAEGQAEDSQAADIQTRNAQEQGHNGEKDADVMFHGVETMRGAPHNGRVQTPVSRHAASDLTDHDGVPHSFSGKTIEQAHTIYGHRVTDSRWVPMEKWAEEASGGDNKRRRALLNEAMEKVLAHDAARLKHPDLSAQDREWILKRQQDAERFKERRPELAGDNFFDTARDGATNAAHRDYGFYRMEKNDAANVSFNEHSIKRFASREDEKPNALAMRSWRREGKQFTADDHKRSILPLMGEGTTPTRYVDVAAATKQVLRTHQLGDVAGVGDKAVADAASLHGKGGDTKRVFTPEQIKGAFLQVVAALTDMKGVDGRDPFGPAMKEHVAASNHADKVTVSKKDATTHVEQRHFNDKLVVYRDEETGKAYTYGELTGVRGEDHLGRIIKDNVVRTDVKRADGSTVTKHVATMPAADPKQPITGLLSPRDTGRVMAEKNAVAEKVLASKGILRGAVTGPDGKTYNLDVRGMLSHMFNRLGEFAHEVMQDGTSIPRELAARMIYEGVRELERNGYKVNFSGGSEATAGLKMYDRHYGENNKPQTWGTTGSRENRVQGVVERVEAMRANAAAGHELPTLPRSLHEARIQEAQRAVAALQSELAARAKEQAQFGMKNSDLSSSAQKTLADRKAAVEKDITELTTDKREAAAYGIWGELKDVSDALKDFLNAGKSEAKEDGLLEQPLFDRSTQKGMEDLVGAIDHRLSDKYYTPEKAASEADNAKIAELSKQASELVENMRSAEPEAPAAADLAPVKTEAKPFDPVSLAERLNDAAKPMSILEVNKLLTGLDKSQRDALSAALPSYKEAKSQAAKLMISKLSSGDDALFSKEARTGENDAREQDKKEWTERLHGEVKKLVGDAFNFKLDDSPAARKFSAKIDTITKAITTSFFAKDMVGATHHEVWHGVEELLKGMGEHGKTVLNQIYRHTNTPEMRAWLERHLADSPEALKQLDSATDVNAQRERAAFAFQFFMKGDEKMPLAPATRSMWQRLKNWVMDKLQLSTSGVKAEHFFNYLKDGGFLRDMDNPDAVLRGLGELKGDKVVRKMHEAIEPLKSVVGAALLGTRQRLDNIGNAHYSAAAKLIAGDGKGGQYNEMVRQQMKWGNMLTDMFQGKTLEERQKFMLHPDYKAKFLDPFERYFLGKDGGGETGMTPADLRKLYARTEGFDRDAIQEHADEFIRDVVNHGGDMPDGMTARDVASKIIDQGYFYHPEFSLFEGEKGAKILNKWRSKDPAVINSHVINLGTKMAERGRAFGVNDVRLKALIEKGDKIASKDEQQLMKDFVAAYDGSYGGRFSDGIEKFQDALLVANNVRLLPMGLFGQMLEPMQLAFRKNDVASSLGTLFDGVGSLIKDSLAKDDSPENRDYWKALGQRLGAVAHDHMGSTLAGINTGYNMKGMAGKVNDWFFKMNGQEKWDRIMRRSAVQDGVSFLREHAAGSDVKHSARFLKHLGVEASDIKFNKKGEIDLNENNSSDPKEMARANRVERALVQYVNEAMAHPDAGSNPLLFNDRRFALLAQMKKFSYAHQEYVLKRGYNEVKHGNLAPLAPLVAAVPWMLAADSIRDMLNPMSDTSYKNNWDFTDKIAHGFERSGGWGALQGPKDLLDSAQHGQGPLEGLSPTTELVGRIATGSKNGHMLDVLINGIPGMRAPMAD
jgi:hypothetical protein